MIEVLFSIIRTTHSPTKIGICRIAFSVDDIDRTYADLQAKKVQLVAPLKKIRERAAP